MSQTTTKRHTVTVEKTVRTKNGIIHVKSVFTDKKGLLQTINQIAKGRMKI